MPDPRKQIPALPEATTLADEDFLIKRDTASGTDEKLGTPLVLQRAEEYDNSASGLSATTKSGAIDELNGDIAQNIAVFDEAGVTEWTVPGVLRLGLRKCHVEVIGGGAGGGSSLSDPGSGPGGGGGGLAYKIVDLTDVSSVPVTVGAAGNGASAGQSDSTNGGSSSFGSYVSASGGSAPGAVSSGNSGVGQGGDLNTGLGPGISGSQATSGEPGSGGGPGGGAIAGQQPGASARGPGGGGGGGSRDSQPGGNGFRGQVTVRW